MKQFYFLIITFFILSCNKKKNEPISIDIPEVEVTKEGKIIAIDTAYLYSKKDSLLNIFYKSNNNHTFWLAFNCRENLLQLINNVENQGLNKNEFDYIKINNLEKRIFNLNDDELIDYDILLTQNLSRFISKASTGKLDPKELYNDWELKKNSPNTLELLLNFTKKDSFDYAVSSIKPSHKAYYSLEDAMKILEKFPDKNFTKLSLEGKLELNDTNNIIPEIKQRLIYWKDLKSTTNINSVYDIETKIAVKKFQLRHGLASDGVIGKGTVSALNFSKLDRKKQIIANIERWKWFPREFESEYIIINIPDYSLQFIKNKDTVRTHKIIVGTNKRTTPILSSKLSYVVFNPTWTVPPTILREDVIPASTKDRSYLTAKKITVFDSNNNVVTLENWNPQIAKSYRYVQSPGSYNSLGLVKIMFPNKFSVYLHDTNNRSYFSRENRSISSGCVRVQDPFELTEDLIEDKINWNLDSINSVVKKGKTKNVTINKKVYIHILYWTAFSKNGELHFRDDIYNLDMELYNKLRN